MSPHVSLPKGVDNSMQPESNHVQSTKLWPQIQNGTANRSSANDFDDTVSSLAESVHMETASSSDSDSSDTEEMGNRQGPHSNNSHSAYRGSWEVPRIAVRRGGWGCHSSKAPFRDHPLELPPIHPGLILVGGAGP